jgi:S-adenosylmethionine/arginine decarboxylase-like enzyme
MHGKCLIDENYKKNIKEIKKISQLMKIISQETEIITSRKNFFKRKNFFSPVKQKLFHV